jgi:hypothetical protein
MAKPASLFPQRVTVINTGLVCTRISADEALLSTDLGRIRVPLKWWLAHQKDSAFVLVVTAIEADPKHVWGPNSKESK